MKSNLFKKAVSLLVAVASSLSVFTASISAASSTVFTNDFETNNTWGGYNGGHTSAIVAGFAGNDTNVLKIEKTDTGINSTDNIRVVTNPGASGVTYLNDDSSKKYFKLDMKFYVNDDGFKSFGPCSSWGDFIAPQLALEGNDAANQIGALKKGEWNEVTYIFCQNWKNSSNAKSISTKTDIYVNEELVANGTEIYFGNPDETTFNVRLRMDSVSDTSASKTFTAYYDDVVLTTYTQNPVNVLYKNDFESSDIGVGNGSFSYAENFDGNTTKSAKIDKSSGADYVILNPGQNTAYLNDDSTKKYFKLDFKVYVDDDKFKYLAPGSAWNDIMGAKLALEGEDADKQVGALKKGQWNEVTYVIWQNWKNSDNVKSISTMSDIYVNGVQVGEAIEYYFGNPDDSTFTVKLRMDSDASDDTFTSYIDDLTLTTYAYKPSVKLKEAVYEDVTLIEKGTGYANAVNVYEGGVVAEVAGIKGKAADDTVTHIIADNETRIIYEVPADFWATESNDLQYLVFNAQFTGSGFDYFGFKEAKGEWFTPFYSPTGLADGQWHNVTFIYDRASETRSVRGTTYAYIDGVGGQVDGTRTPWGQLSDEMTKISFFANNYQEIDGDATTTKAIDFYWDNVEMYITNTMPEISAITMPTLSAGNTYSVSGYDITLQNVTKVSDFQGANNDGIRAYRDGRAGQALTANDTVEVGDTVIVTSGDDLRVYTVAADNTPVSEFVILDNNLTYSSNSNDWAGVEEDDVKVGTYKYTVTAKNTTGTPEAVTAILALYDGDTLKGVDYVTQTLAGDTDSQEVTATLTVAEVTDGMHIKTFIWDDEMEPISKKVKVLVIGNSITAHTERPEAGWYGDWGMAASSEDKDYVHQLIAKADEKYANVEFMWENISQYEMYFYNFDFVTSDFAAIKEFDADIIISAFGANVGNSTNEEDEGYLTEEQFTTTHYKNIVNEFNTSGVADVIAVVTPLTREATNITTEAAATEAKWAFVDTSSITGDSYDATSYYQNYPEIFGTNVWDSVLSHPGDAGMAAMADSIWVELEKAIVNNM